MYIYILYFAIVAIPISLYFIIKKIYFLVVFSIINVLIREAEKENLTQ